MSIRTFRIISVIANLVTILIDLFLGIFLFHFSKSFYYCTLFFIMGIAFLNYGLIILAYYTVKGYDMKPFTLAIHSSYLMVSIAAYYFIRNLDYYDEYPYLYWVIPGIIIFIFITLFVILDKKQEKKQKNKPNIKANIK